MTAVAAVSSGMWATFWPDILVATIGAMLTVAIGLITYLVQQRRSNEQLVRNLADDLAMRRAFMPISPSVTSPLGDDPDRCRKSVQSAQAQIALIRDQIAPDHRLRALLQEMAAWTREFKSLNEADPERWQFALMEVRGELVVRLRAVERVMRLKAGSLPDPGTAEVSRDRT
ncbi:hypothetical protein [Clavibacter lycopersici]|nr:hypothetical protein [Clavibacter lycopersici]